MFDGPLQSRVSYVSLLRQRPVLVLWLAETLSVFGDRFFTLALAWTAWQRSGAVAMGLVVVVESVPHLLIGVFGRKLVARFASFRALAAVEAVQVVIVGATGTALDRAGAHCTRITVPLDYSRPTGPTTRIALSRLPASDRAHRIGTLVLNHGGPAEPTLGMPLETRAYMGKVAARYDLVGIDPRFVGRSTPIDCGWPTGIWIRSAGTGRAAFDRQVAFQRELAAGCVRRHGDVLPYCRT